MFINRILSCSCFALLLILSINRVAVGANTAAEALRQVNLALAGGHMTEKQARALEHRISKHPDDLAVRTKLLGFYFSRKHQSDKARKHRIKHVVWVLRNRPEAYIAGEPWTELDPAASPHAYVAGAKAWRKQVRSNPKNVTILSHAVSYLLLHKTKKAEKLLKRAKKIQPRNPEWPERLAHLYDLSATGQPSGKRKAYASKALQQYQRALNLTTAAKQRYYLLDDLAEAALTAGKARKARTYAQKLLKMSRHYKRDWNYGNAIYDGHSVLGQLALAAGELRQANAHLMKAGDTPGSPQLNSFGPDLTLADQLLEKGQKHVVLRFLRRVKGFWKMGRPRIRRWISTIKAGGEVNLHRGDDSEPSDSEPSQQK